MDALALVAPAAIDPNLFTTVVALLAGGGLWQAYSTFRKTPVEVESISVATLSGALKQMGEELERKDRAIKEQDQTIGELRRRIEQLEAA